MERLRN